MTASSPQPSPDFNPENEKRNDEPATPDISVSNLLHAMGRGERQAAAEFVIRYGPQIRRRVRGKLRVSMRRLFDSQDILSTLARRLDSYVASGNFEAKSEGELWSLVFTIAERSIAEKTRIWESLTKSVPLNDELGPTVKPDDDYPLFCVVWDPEVVSEDDYAELVGLLGDLYEASGGTALTRIKERGFGVTTERGVVA